MHLPPFDVFIGTGSLGLRVHRWGRGEGSHCVHHLITDTTFSVRLAQAELLVDMDDFSILIVCVSWFCECPQRQQVLAQQ